MGAVPFGFLSNQTQKKVPSQDTPICIFYAYIYIYMRSNQPVQNIAVLFSKSTPKAAQKQ